MSAPRVHYAGPLKWDSGRSTYHVIGDAAVCSGALGPQTTRMPRAVDCARCRRILQCVGLLGNERGVVGRSCT